MRQRTLEFWKRAFRHRWKLIDASVVLIATLLAILYAYEVKIFRTPGSSPATKTIELDEILLIAAFFCGAMFLFAIRRLAEARHEAERRVAAEREARALAFHDALTGLPNRRKFQQALQIAMASPAPSGTSDALMLMDLNRFKRVNDLFGHRAGDDVLVEVAKRLGGAARGGHLAVRLAGDEFAILARQLSGVEAATALAGQLVELLEEPIMSSAGEQNIGVAIGIALTSPDVVEPEEFIRRADIALRRAKEQKHGSRSAMRFFQPATDVIFRERDQLERELRLAIRHREIRPFFQPIVALQGRAIAGFEALARWTSPLHGAVSPARFIAVAEDCGLIGELTEMLLEQALAVAVTWPSDVTLAFNISGASLGDKVLGSKIMQALAQSGLPPMRLELEITESALVRDLDTARRVLGGLQKAGIRIALDDFGTGYSSLYHLRMFKPDKIKIDRSFVDGIANEPANTAIVQAIIGLGTGLGATITAEGIETVEQEALLRQQGCDQGQGYLFGEAIDGAGTVELLAFTDAKRRQM